MLGLGATRMEVQQRSVKTWFPAGRLEITALDPVPALPPRAARIDGSDARLLENASILCGKLYGRGRRMPERDVFDVCVAATEDPDALRCAVNHVGPDTRREIAHLLAIGADMYRESAPEVILEPAPRFADLLEEAPERAAELIRDETWASTDFDYALEGAVTVTARTVGGTVVSRTCRSGQALAAAMLGMGLEEMMLGRHGTMRAFVQGVDTRLR